PSDLSSTVKERAAAYAGDQVFTEEEARDKKHREDDARYRRLLIEGPVLELPMPLRQYSFDPNATFPLGPEGIVFPESQISDAWGVIQVSKGVRVNSKYDTAFVPAPSSSEGREGDGWKLTLKPGWKLAPGTRKGDFKVVKEG